MKRYNFFIIILLIINLSLLFLNLYSYNFSVYNSRIIIYLTFISIVISLCYSNINYQENKYMPYIFLFLFAVMFLLQKTVFSGNLYSKDALYTDSIYYSGLYRSTETLFVSGTRSYFFTNELLLYMFDSFIKLTDSFKIYILTSIFFVFTFLTSSLYMSELNKFMVSDKINNKYYVLSGFVGLNVISVLYSERGLFGTNIAQITSFLIFFYIFFKHDFKTGIARNLFLILMIIGVCLGDQNGVMILIPLLIFRSLFTRKITDIILSIIPVFYLFVYAETYRQYLLTYLRFSIFGLQDFISKIFSISSINISLVNKGLAIDNYLVTFTYLSVLFLASLIILINLILYIIKQYDNEEKIHYMPTVVGMFIIASLATITYFGISSSVNTTFSDIRTILITLLSFLIPLAFTNKKLVKIITNKRIIYFMTIFLLIGASFKTFYDFAPKSSQDPIIKIEDLRLGTDSIYTLIPYVNTHIKTTQIVADYKTLNRDGSFFNNQKRFLLDDKYLNDNSTAKRIIIFNCQGVIYPSPYHSSDLYESTYNYSLTKSIVFNNGVVIISKIR
jgi:hypothetical protein